MAQTQTEPSPKPFDRSCLLQNVAQIEGNVTIEDVAAQLQLAHAALNIIYTGGTLPRGKWLRRLLRNLGTIESQLELGALSKNSPPTG